MALIITDDVLENLTCNACDKFLSVPPIKVYANRKIECGRCREEKENAGVTSLFNILANKCVFKCVNRFDGCRELLNYPEVKDHESKCAGKSYLCPICPVSTIVPTFRMIPHFQKHHKNMYLDMPSFFINLNQAARVTNFFLHRHKDRLFVIIFKNDSSIDHITMSAMLLGDQEDARNMLQSFTLRTSNGLELYSRKIPCAAFDLSEDYGLNMEKCEILKYHRMLNVTFKINMFVDSLMKLPEKYHSTITEQSDQAHNHFRLRYIHLTESFRRTHPEFSIASNLTSLVKNVGKIKYEIVLCCWNCSLLLYCGTAGFKNVYMIKKEKHYMICYSCYYYKRNCLLTTPSVELSQDALQSVQFFCFWKCGKLFNITSLNEHEINCCLQPLQKCPVKNCQYTDKLFDIKQHLLKIHPDFSVLFKKKDEELSLALMIEASPKKYFIAVKHDFILVTFVWIEPQWEISIFKCNSSRNCDRLKAVALIFNKDNTLLRSLNQNESAKFCHTEKVKIHCYFAKEKDTCEISSVGVSE